MPVTSFQAASVHYPVSQTQVHIVKPAQMQDNKVLIFTSMKLYIHVMIYGVVDIRLYIPTLKSETVLVWCCYKLGMLNSKQAYVQNR